MALRLPRINRTWLMLFVAIMLGLGATWLTTQYLKIREQRLEADLAAKSQTGPGVKVVVPVKNLPRGITIDQTMVAAREIPSDLVYSDMITVATWDKYNGAKLVRAVEPGLPLRTADIEERGKDFSDLLESGTRAITVETDDLNSISQMVRPGNLIDLLVILPDASDVSGTGQQIVLFMQRLKVFATGQRVTKADEPAVPGQAPSSAARYSTFTFEVTPEQAARIALAQTLGKFRVVLRKEPDEEIVRLGRINTRNILSKAALDNTPEEKERGSETAVEYIIGGRGQAGVGNTITVNVPGLQGAPGMAPGAVPGAPAAAGAGPVMGMPSGIPSAAQPYFPQVPIAPAAK